jgi:hypothetical protein
MNAALARCATIAIASAACACAGTEYTGDGTFERVEKSSFLCSERYFVLLGSLDLSRPALSSYQLAGLPETEFTLGIVIAHPKTSGDSVPIGALHARIRVDLRDEENRRVILTDGRLSDWTWSSDLKRWTNAFVYRRGEERQRDLGNGSTTSQRIGVNADSGWGTSFKPRSRGHYRLEVAVKEGDAGATQYDVSLRADGGYGCEL